MPRMGISWNLGNQELISLPSGERLFVAQVVSFSRVYVRGVDMCYAAACRVRCLY